MPLAATALDATFLAPNCYVNYGTLIKMRHDYMPIFGIKIELRTHFMLFVIAFDNFFREFQITYLLKWVSIYCLGITWYLN